MEARHSISLCPENDANNFYVITTVLPPSYVVLRIKSAKVEESYL